MRRFMAASGVVNFHVAMRSGRTSLPPLIEGMVTATGRGLIRDVLTASWEGYRSMLDAVKDPAPVVFFIE